ncbi:MAG: HD domain-containing protein, partial [Desulfobacterales bacterium]
VAVEMKRTFKRDFKRIGQASRRARYAERIAGKARGTLPVVLCAAYLRDIGAPQALQKYGDTTGDHLAQESPVVARAILTALQASDPLIDAVCTIVGHHHTPASDAPPDLKIVYDADWMARMEERLKSQPLDDGQLSDRIEAEMLTAAGKEEARAVLLR